ncbi:MAG TPA: MBL fold metallo-hydrolase [Actinomycetota bacterium]|jgi:glyoxylase-like metal-dependent hydrolase (beta-lactamase superfamily II)|nr:MBL fold metallo-hydrolase [Actinomycetota bacterium]
MELSVVERWFAAREVRDGLTLLWEPHVDPYLISNIWHLRGSERDLLVDTGNGLGRLRPVIEAAARGRPVIAVATHAHFDHVGGLTEFDDRWIHRADAPALRGAEDPLRLRRSDLSPAFLADMAFYGFAPPEVLVHALPRPDFDVAGFRTPACQPTRLLEDGDRVELGDRSFVVLHVPGHTPGSLALWDGSSGVLFTGDTVYADDPVSGADRDAFHRSLRRLRDLPVSLVCAGHNRPIGPEELVRIIDGLLRG